MKKIAIVGNIACGKSVAFEIIKKSGFSVVDCDDIVSDLYKNQDIIDYIKESFPEIITDNVIDKIKIKNLIFSNKNFKTNFEKFIFNNVKIQIEKFFENNLQNDIVFVVAPLLFESKLDILFDTIVFISSDEDIRENRLIQRSSLLSDIAKSVIKSQIPEAKKIKLSDYVIKNNGTLNEFQHTIISLIKTL